MTSWTSQRWWQVLSLPLSMVSASINREKSDEATELKLKAKKLKYVSRGGLKLESPEPLGLSVEGKFSHWYWSFYRWLYDVMLQNGASQVFSVDVGTNQLFEIARPSGSLRHAEPEILKRHRALWVSDVSFISWFWFCQPFTDFTDNDVVALVKPQFEAGREQIGKMGLVEWILRFISPSLKRSLHFRKGYMVFAVMGVDYSPIQGSAMATSNFWCI